ncbi:MAG: DUF2993 domain-containing protein [Chloroherpetonaceae bacterium]|nr:DUF2993 domain-containing protein [Chthonomonadaceae bacterium]MDW8206593.1 DUF2993 domain-containing protein [Chloroherpetonaceae bacterium]
MMQDACRVAGTLMFLLALTGCDRPVNRAAERQIRRVLPDLIGPARQYDVRVHNAWSRTLGGRLSRVEIDGHQVQITNGLVLDRLQLDLQDVRVDTRSQKVREIRAARFVATVSKPNIDEYLAGETALAENLRRPRVTIHTGNSVTLAAERVALGVGVPFSLTGPLVIAGPRRIAIDPQRMTFIGIPIWGPPLDFLKSRFETGLDLNNLPFPVTLRAIRTEPDRITLSGEADVSAVIQRADVTYRRTADAL